MELRVGAERFSRYVGTAKIFRYGPNRDASIDRELVGEALAPSAARS
jgi:hypothetical protein